MSQQINYETKTLSNSNQTNLMIIKMKDNATWELRHTEAASRREDIINKRRKNDDNHKILFYAKITTDIYQYPI